jgi:hypothetical protein
MEVFVALLLLALVAAFVSVPLRRRAADAAGAGEDPVLAELEARKQAKYREIRDTELDHAQGKLSDREFRVQEAELKREAIAILEQIDAAQARREARARERSG